MQNMAAPPADTNDGSNPGARSGMPANAGNKIEAEAMDGGARKDNPRAAGNADALDGDKVSKAKDDNGKKEEDLPPLGKDAAVHSKLQQELDQEISKKPESEWGVTNQEGEQAAQVENKIDNANQGESNAPAEPQGSGGLMGKVKHAMHKN